eukprot:scaffold13.g305.t1
MPEASTSAPAAHGPAAWAARPARRQQGRAVARAPVGWRRARAVAPPAAQLFAGGGNSHSPVDRERQVERLMHTVSSPKDIGSEYGEGFMQFRLSGDATHLSVDALNEQLRSAGATRIRHAMRPDEAFGLIFCFENVVADTRGLQRAAWQAVAEAEGLRFPSIERQSMYDVRPEHAITEMLQWTRDWKRARELAWLVAVAYSEQLAKARRAGAGGATTTHAVLDRLELRQHFCTTVTADDDMETIAQRFLSAAIKLGRPPEQCVVFASCAASVVAAHNCTMRAVAVMGAQPAFRLENADLTCSSLAQLSVYNIRRLFSNRGESFMDLRRQGTDAEALPRQLTHATAEPEEEGEELW